MMEKEEASTMMIPKKGDDEIGRNNAMAMMIKRIKRRLRKKETIVIMLIR